jgi:hypothetical protein
LSPGMLLNSQSDADLSLIVTAWPALPAETRATILAMVKAAGG